MTDFDVILNSSSQVSVIYETLIFSHRIETEFLQSKVYHSGLLTYLETSLSRNSL